MRTLHRGGPNTRDGHFGFPLGTSESALGVGYLFATCLGRVTNHRTMREGGPRGWKPEDSAWQNADERGDGRGEEVRRERGRKDAPGRDRAKREEKRDGK